VSGGFEQLADQDAVLPPVLDVNDPQGA